MNHKIISRFAVDGIRKNTKTVLPFIISNIIVVTVFYILSSLAFTPYIYADGKEAFYGAQMLGILLEICSQIVMIFAGIFVIYSNQFVMKNRRREIGLYGILGLTQKNIAMILILDMLIKAGIILVTGILLGTFLNKLVLLLLYKIIHQPVVYGLMFVPKALTNSLTIFGIFYFTCLISNILSVNVANPIELLQSEHAGEREPKVKMGIFVIGVIALAAGYTIALRTKSSMAAIGVILPAVILVIIGTYCLFTSGSIFILKKLRGNKKFYYKTNSFISVSNLMYRMKHNAAGLASICILSTAVLILMTCASSLSILGEENISRMYPQEIKLATRIEKDVDPEDYKNALKDTADENQMEISNVNAYRYVNTIWVKESAGFATMEPDMFLNVDGMEDVYLLTVDDYNQYADSAVAIKDNEILYTSTDMDFDQQVDILGNTYQIAGTVDRDKLSYVVNSTMDLFGKAFIVVPNEDMLMEMLSTDFEYTAVNDGYYNTGEIDLVYNLYAGANFKGTLSDEEMKNFNEGVLTKLGLPVDGDVGIDYKQGQQAFFYNLYGGIFFVGIFLAAMFLMTTVLIIYYKQLSEGYEDQKRYEILACVGLTEEEIRGSIRRQVQIMFFLPLVTAIIHTIAASHIVRLFLQTIMVVRWNVFMGAMAIVAVIFVIIYTIVYKITSREYFNIVNA